MAHPFFNFGIIMSDFIYINKIYFGCMYDILLKEKKVDKDKNIKAKLNYNNSYIKCKYDDFFKLKDWRKKHSEDRSDYNYDSFKTYIRTNMLSIPICSLSEFSYRNNNIKSFITLSIEVPNAEYKKDDILDFEQYTDIFYDWDEAKLKAEIKLKELGYIFNFKGGI